MQKKTKRKKSHVVILGGGLAGLAAGFELSKSNFQVTVVEMQDDVGGLARTIEKNGFRFDTGPHRWYTKNDMVNQWMLDLMGEEIIKVPRLTRIYFDKKFFYYPIRFKNALIGMGPTRAVRAVLDYLWVRLLARIRSKRIETLEDGYIEKFGRTLYETFFKRYSEKLWGRPCIEVSSDWIGQRTRGFNIGTILKQMLFKSRDVVSFVDEFSYPKKGIGRIAQKLAEEIKKNNGDVKVNTRIRKIFHKKGNIAEVEVFAKGKKQRIAGNHFISTIPLSDVVFGLLPKAPQKLVKLAKNLSYRDEIQVTLFVKKANITPDTWIYVHPKNISFMRFMEMDNWSNALSPAGETAIVFEIPCNVGDHLWKMNKKELIRLVTDEFIQEFNLVARKDIHGGYVHKMQKEYPIYHIGYKKDVDGIKKYLKRFSNFQIAGRNGTFRYNNMDHSIEMGLHAARNIIEGKIEHDIDSVNIKREYLEEKKIELPEDEYVEKSEKD